MKFFVQVAVLLAALQSLASAASLSPFATSAPPSTAFHPKQSHPERGKRLRNPFNASDLLQVYRNIQAEYKAKAFANESNWKVLHRQDDVEVALLDNPDDPLCPYVRMKGKVPVSVQECWDFLRVENWNQNMPKMDPWYEGHTVHGEFTHDNVDIFLCRKRTKRLLTFGKRDIVFLSVADEPQCDGTWVSGSVSVDTSLLPRQPGYVRAFQDSIAFYKPLKGNTMTDLTFICRMDLNDSGEGGQGGGLPMWLYVKTIGVSGTQAVMRMRKALIEDKARRLAMNSGASASGLSN